MRKRTNEVEVERDAKVTMPDGVVLLADVYQPVGIDDAPTDDFRFASAVVEFGLLLRDSPFKGKANWDSIQERAESSDFIVGVASFAEKRAPEFTGR